MKHSQKISFRGFSLVELLVVVSIIGLLLAASVVSYSTINKKSRDTRRKSDVEQIRQALEMYKSENGYYPGTGAGLWTDASNLTDLVPTYIPSIPADPKSGQVYRYQATNQNSGVYTGYCMSASLELENPTGTCTPDTLNSQNYGLRNP